MNDPDFDPYLPPRAPVGKQRPEMFGTAEAIDGNPWLTIWTRPRGTIRSIVDTDPTRSVVVLAMIYGISSTLSRALQNDQGDKLSLPAIIGLALIGGSIGGVIGNYVVGALVRWVGGWFGGVASSEECRAAMAWGSVPHVVNLALMAVLIVVFGQDLFKAAALEGVGNEKAILLIGVGLAQITIGIWSAVLSIKCVAEVHRFSAWKALGTFLLMFLVLIGVILVIVMAVFALMAVMKVNP